MTMMMMMMMMMWSKKNAMTTSTPTSSRWCWDPTAGILSAARPRSLCCGVGVFVFFFWFVRLPCVMCVYLSSLGFSMISFFVGPKNTQTGETSLSLSGEGLGFIWDI